MIEADIDRAPGPLDLIREHRLIVVWTLLALASGLLRLIVINRLPLNEAEAAYAFPAWQALLGRLDGSLVDSGAPLLSHTLVVLLGLFGASDVTARLLPALAGTALTLTPALLSVPLGARTTFWAGALIAVSPIALQASRVLDPATLAAALAMLVVCSAIRLATDRPWWSAWTLALGAGLSLAASGGAVLALLVAGLGALALFARPTPEAGWRGWLEASFAEQLGAARGFAGPAALFAGAGLFTATGALTDLRGIGFMLGEVWQQAFGLLVPDAFPTRSLGALLAYGAPLLILAAIGYLLARRGARPPRRERRGRHGAVEATDLLELEGLEVARRERLRVLALLGLWSLILVVVTAVSGRGELTLVLLPVAPAALLAGSALARLPLDIWSYELGTEGWTMLAIGLILALAAFVIFSQKVAAGGQTPLVAPAALLGLLILLAIGWRSLASEERTTVFAVLGGLALVGLTISGISRASFGGSPPGTDLLTREETDPAFRALFRELNVRASADPSRVLVIDLPQVLVVRWYGRSIPTGSGGGRNSPGAWILREATTPPSSDPSQVVRVPWKTTSEIGAADVYPLGILRWLVTRSALVHAKPQDIIVTR
jgi:hypothetical protein